MRIDKLDRKPGTSKDGRPYTMLFVTSGGVKYSCFETPGITDKWVEGMEIDYPTAVNGKYNNIVLPKKSKSGSAPSPLTDEILDNTRKIIDQNRTILALLSGNPKAPRVEDEIPPPTDDDMPF